MLTGEAMGYLLPIMIVVGLWWLSTVFLLYRTGMPRSSSFMTLSVAVVGSLLGIFFILLSRGDYSVMGAYVAFVSALAIWSVHETSYLLGYVTGPRALACPPDVSPWRRFWYGVAASLYHEIAVVLTAGLIALMTWDSPNRVALWTFTVLWLMRWSAKLNIFLGVRNLHSEYWPPDLQYLGSYARQKNMNILFPWSVLGAATGVVLMVLAAIESADDPTQRAAMMLVASILSLALLEHLFLMLRIPDETLWRLGARSRSPGDLQEQP